MACFHSTWVSPFMCKETHEIDSYRQHLISYKNRINSKRARHLVLVYDPLISPMQHLIENYDKQVAYENRHWFYQHLQASSKTIFRI